MVKKINYMKCPGYGQEDIISEGVQDHSDEDKIPEISRIMVKKIYNNVLPESVQDRG